jgi:hypothetical protein
MQKTYYQQDNIGRVKYTISYHNGKDTHKDGSPFFGIKLFSNKQKVKEFEKQLLLKGYQYKN